MQHNESSNLLPSGDTSDSIIDATRRSAVFTSMHHVPLLLSSDVTNAEDDRLMTRRRMEEADNNEEGRGTAGRTETVLNIVKTCLGTGIIALPFAASQVDCWVHIIGILAIALWCLVCVQRLLSCLDLVQLIQQSRKADMPNECSGLGEVAFVAYGRVGYHMMDLIFFGLLFMIIVAYLDAALGFLQDTLFFTSNRLWNALIPAIIIGYLTSAGDQMDSLSKVSAFGIGLIMMVFGILIFGYGDFDGRAEWPTLTTSATDLAQWYGTAVFGFGLVPLTYNFRASMEQKSDMMMASAIGLSGTSLLYIILSVGVVSVFPTSLLQGDVLQLLPNDDSFLPTLVRLAMVGLVITTAPLLVLPCGELMQDAFLPTDWPSVYIRMGICIAAALLTLYLPGFVFVLSFVGSCWCILSFVIPPLFHLALLRQVQQIRCGADLEVEFWTLSDSRWSLSFFIDVSLLLLGVFATLSSSIYTFQSLLESTT